MSVIDKPIGPKTREKTRNDLARAMWVSAYSGDDIVWRDSEEKGTCWVEVVDGIEYLVAGDADGVRVMQMPTALLVNFVRLARLPDSGYVEVKP